MEMQVIKQDKKKTKEMVSCLLLMCGLVIIREYVFFFF